MTDAQQSIAGEERSELWAEPEVKSPHYFGEHVLIDGYGGCAARLADPCLLDLLLHDLAHRLRMRILREPVVCLAPGNGLNDPGGLTAFVVVQESHISVHTFPARRFVSGDIYSCRRGLLQEAIVREFARAFQLEGVDAQLVRRGMRYPESDFPS